MSLTSLGDITRMAAELPGALQQAQRRGVGKAALHVTTGIRGEIRASTGGDSRLSGVGRRGARVGARYDVKGSTNPTALVRATGPIQLIEHDTSPHEIRPRRRRRTKALKLKDGTYAASASHTGTRAKRPFAKGVRKTADQTGAVFDREVQAAIRRTLR